RDAGVAALEVDVRAGGEGRQGIAVVAGQGDVPDAFGGVLDRNHAHGATRVGLGGLTDVDLESRRQHRGVLPLRVRGGVPLDEEVLGAAEGGVGHVVEV